MVGTSEKRRYGLSEPPLSDTAVMLRMAPASRTVSLIRGLRRAVSGAMLVPTAKSVATPAAANEAEVALDWTTPTNTPRPRVIQRTIRITRRSRRSQGANLSDTGEG